MAYGPEDDSPEVLEQMLARETNDPSKKYSPAQQREQVRRAMLLAEQGKTEREIADALGVSKGTARNRIATGFKQLPSADIETHRKQENERLDVALAEVMKVMRETTDPDIILKCSDRIVRIGIARTRINGFDSVKVEGTVVHKTQMESELEAMLNAAAQENARIEQEIKGNTQ